MHTTMVYVNVNTKTEAQVDLTHINENTAYNFLFNYNVRY